MHKDNIIQEDIKNIANSLRKNSLVFEGKTILITGGSGFLGKYIIETFLYLNKDILKKPCRIINIDNNITSYKSKSLKKEKYIQYINHDVARPIRLKEKLDYIIHAAGIASPIYYQKYPLEAISVAVDGTRNMLELARKKKVKAFLFFSSSEIYGDPPREQIPTKETYNGNVSSIGPRACYDESKRLGETLCMTYYNLYKTPVKIVRPFNVFGPNMRSEDYRVIPRFIYNALNKKPIPVYIHGKQTRSFCYIADAVLAFFLVLLKGKNGEVYNVGSDNKEITINELAGIINDLFNKQLNIKNLSYPSDYPQGEPQRRSPDLTKIKRETGYRPLIEFREGLNRTKKWCELNW